MGDTSDQGPPVAMEEASTDDTKFSRFRNSLSGMSLQPHQEGQEGPHPEGTEAAGQATDSGAQEHEAGARFGPQESGTGHLEVPEARRTAEEEKGGEEEVCGETLVKAIKKIGRSHMRAKSEFTAADDLMMMKDLLLKSHKIELTRLRKATFLEALASVSSELTGEKHAVLLEKFNRLSSYVRTEPHATSFFLNSPQAQEPQLAEDGSGDGHASLSAATPPPAAPIRTTRPRPASNGDSPSPPSLRTKVETNPTVATLQRMADAVGSRINITADQFTSPGSITAFRPFINHTLDWLLELPDGATLHWLGEGSCGAVFAALNHGEPVAVKLRALGLTDDDDAAGKIDVDQQAERELAINESLISSGLSEEDVIVVPKGVGVCEVDGLLYIVIVMPRFRGTLLDLLEQQPLSRQTLVAAAYALFKGLDHLHQLGIVYVDASASNLFYKVDAEGRVRVCLGDFSHAYFEVKNDGCGLPHPSTSPPEVLSQDLTNTKADVYTAAMAFLLVLLRLHPDTWLARLWQQREELKPLDEASHEEISARLLAALRHVHADGTGGHREGGELLWALLDAGRATMKERGGLASLAVEMWLVPGLAFHESERPSAAQVVDMMRKVKLLSQGGEGGQRLPELTGGGHNGERGEEEEEEESEGEGSAFGDDN